MKRKITLLILILFIGSFFYGCEDWFKEDEKENYIIVSIGAKGWLRLKNSNNEEFACPEILHNTLIRVDAIKAQGLRHNLTLEIEEDCGFDSYGTLVTFNLYKEQDIFIYAHVESVPDEYMQITDSDHLSWAEVYSKKDFGETYTWYPTLTPYWMLKEQ